MKRHIEMASLGLIAASIGAIVMPVLGVLEGTLWPAVDPRLTIASTTPVGAYETQLSGTATKVRACAYVPGSLRWYWGAPGEPSTSVPATFRDPPQKRARGVTEWSAIVVGLPADAVIRNSYATVEHKCHPLWRTVTLFYQARETPDAEVVR